MIIGKAHYWRKDLISMTIKGTGHICIADRLHIFKCKSLQMLKYCTLQASQAEMLIHLSKAGQIQKTYKHSFILKSK